MIYHHLYLLTVHSVSTFKGKASAPVSATLGNWRPDERHAISRSANENLKELKRSKMTTSAYKRVSTRTQSKGKGDALSSSKPNWNLSQSISHPLQKNLR